MTCMPKSGKCEWNDIKHFVQHFNTVNGSKFSHKCCLDLSGSDKQPEVLCVDPAGNGLVIERKTLVWPPDAVQRHKIEHKFWGFISESLGEGLRSGPFALRVAFPGVVNDRVLHRIAIEVADQFRPYLPSLEPGAARRITTPIGAVLWREHEGERDEPDPQVGLAIHSSESEHEELRDVQELPAEFTSKLGAFFDDCRLKFAAYETVGRILLLNFVSAQLHFQLDADWWRDFFGFHVPHDVDEVWACFEVEEGAWEFDRIYAARSIAR